MVQTKKPNSSFCAWKMELSEKTVGWGSIPRETNTEDFVSQGGFKEDSDACVVGTVFCKSVVLLTCWVVFHLR